MNANVTQNIHNATQKMKLTCLELGSLTHLKLFIYVDYIQLGAHHMFKDLALLRSFIKFT
jgi:hypothetical protein